MEFTLERTGSIPLLIDGEQVAYATSPSPDDSRIHIITVFKTAVNYVVSVRYETTWKHEHNHSMVDVLDTDDEVIDWLQSYDVASDIVGYPDGAQFERKQQLLIDYMHSGFGGAISQVASELGVVERL